jgi:hypothetical protein
VGRQHSEFHSFIHWDPNECHLKYSDFHIKNSEFCFWVWVNFQILFVQIHWVFSLIFEWFSLFLLTVTFHILFTHFQVIFYWLLLTSKFLKKYFLEFQVPLIHWSYLIFYLISNHISYLIANLIAYLTANLISYLICLFNNLLRPGFELMTSDSGDQTAL